MKKYFYLFLICLSSAFISCSSNDNHEDDTSMRVYIPETYTSDFLNLENVPKWIKTENADIHVGQVGLLRIEGGDGKYTAQSANEEIVEILMHPADRKVFTIASQDELGSTTITVKDNDNNILTIPITVSKYTKTYQLCQGKPEIVIMKGEKEPEDVIKDAIIDKIEESYILKGYTLELTYEKSNWGRLAIKNSKEGIIYSGVFEEYKDNKYNYLDITVNGQKYHYVVTNNYSDLLRHPGPETIHFVEDLTELFQTDYPALTKVLVITTVCL